MTGQQLNEMFKALILMRMDFFTIRSPSANSQNHPSLQSYWSIPDQATPVVTLRPIPLPNRVVRQRIAAAARLVGLFPTGVRRHPVGTQTGLIR
jgi:hypothetical protein